MDGCNCFTYTAGVLLDQLNRFARDGTVMPAGGISAADAAAWIDACADLLDRRIGAERETRYRRVTKHTRAIEAILGKAISNQRKAAAIRTYLRTLSPRERSDMISLRIVPGLLADARTGPDLIRSLLRRAREQQRLWRRRLDSCPNVAAAINAERTKRAHDREPLLDADDSVLQRWQAELDRLWSRAIRRCEYAPDCEIPGGRYFVGRSKECPDCRTRHSRVTGYRHRRKHRPSATESAR